MIPDKILNVFNRSIKMVCSNIACYCNDPISDFTRKRKLPVETLIHFIIQMQSKSLNSELCEYFNDIDSSPTSSALCMYHMRWDIETAFKMLKYIIGMTSFHSKKRIFIQQEIYAAILLHCLTNIITERIEVEQSDKRKHDYKVNLSTAVTNMRLWLRKLIGTKELVERIKKYLAPVRPDRKYQRNMRPKSVVPFNTKTS